MERFRIVAGAGRAIADIEWYTSSVLDKVNATMRDRMVLAVEYLEAKIVQNISTPVGVSIGPRGGRVVERSRRGEYPRMDTGQLVESIYSHVRIGFDGIVEGVVGSKADYAIYLETSLERPFLTRTLEENAFMIRTILLKPIA